MTDRPQITALANAKEDGNDEIGSVSTEYRGCDGKPAIVGGMRCCKECHDQHYAVTRAERGDTNGA